MRSLSALLACLLFSLPARAESPKLVAVLPLNASDSIMQKQDRELLEDVLRAVAGEELRTSGFTVLTSENTLRILEDNGVNLEKCGEASCELETARELKSEYFVSGRINRINNTFVALLRLSEQKTGKQLRVLNLEADDVLGLKTAMLQRGPELFVGLKSVRGLREGRIGEEKSFELGGADEVVVTFESTPPGANVRIDGQLLCQATPCSKTVAAGTHEVVVEKERYAPLRRTASFSKDARQFSGKLEAQFGTLEIKSVPEGLPVTVDGVAVKSGQLVEVDPGLHEVLLASDCHLANGERVQVGLNERRLVELRATPRYAGLQVRTAAKNGDALEGELIVDGDEFGTVPGKFKVPICAKNAVVRFDKGGVWGAKLELTEGETATFEAVPGVLKEGAYGEPLIEKWAISARADVLSSYGAQFRYSFRIAKRTSLGLGVGLAWRTPQTLPEGYQKDAHDFQFELFGAYRMNSFMRAFVGTGYGFTGLQCYDHNSDTEKAAAAKLACQQLVGTSAKSLDLAKHEWVSRVGVELSYWRLALQVGVYLRVPIHELIAVDYGPFVGPSITLAFVNWRD